MYDFIGDLSEADAALLVRYGEQYDRILEFGAGGSTQLLAQCQPETLISVETDPVWIEKTRKNLEQFQHKTDPVFVSYGAHIPMTYGMIFVDGVWDKRLEFAMKTWPLLSDYGVMIFHDTRRWFDAENAFKICIKFYDEIDHVLVNADGSNCTVVAKRPKIIYENWNETEGKPKWAYGIGDKPE